MSIFGILFLAITSKEQSVRSIPCTRVTGDYKDNSYVNNNQITNSQFSYSSNAPSLSGYPLSNLFDGSNNYWSSATPNSQSFINVIYINFETPTELEAILIDPAYRSFTENNTRNFEGFPLEMKVYSAYANRPYELQATFTGKPIVDTNWGRTQFVFRRPFKCERIMIEFTNVSLLKFWHSSPVMSPGLQNMILIGTSNHFNMPIEPYQNDVYTDAIENTAFTYTSTDAMADHPTSYAFDNIQNTYWIAKNENSDDFKNSITVTFSTQTKLEAISFFALFSTNKQTKVRTFSGFPYVLNVYTSLSDQNVKIHTVFSGSPQDDWDHVQMVFKEPVVCKTLKLEFVTVGVNAFASNKHCPGAHSITFYRRQVDEVQYEKSPFGIDDVRNKRYYNDNIKRSTDGGAINNGYTLEKLFDNNFDRSYWIPQYANDTFRPSVYVEFSEPASIESIYMYNAFSSDHSAKTRRFDGAPTVLKVFTGTYNSDQYELNTIFTGNPGSDYNWAATLFPFKKPVLCQKLKIEFTEVTNNPFAGAPPKAPYIGQLAFIKTAAYGTDEVIGIDPREVYNSTSYINENKIGDLGLSASSAANGHEVAKAFDGQLSTYWKAENANSKAFITININSQPTIDSIIIRPSNNDLTGFPVLINVYGNSGGTNDLQLIAKFVRHETPSTDGVAYSFSKPLSLHTLKLEFEQVYPLSSKSVIPEVSEIILLKEPKDELPLPDNNGNIIASNGNCNQKYRCDQHIYEEEKTNLVIQQSTFNDFQSDSDGGALSLINCGLECKSTTTFRDCTTREGGGAIYFKDEYSVGNTFYIEKATFHNCKATYGGAIYIYTANDFVTIKNCDFVNTVAQQTPTGNSPFYGGSALFLTYNEGELSDLRFNQMSGNIVKIFNNFNEKPPSLKLLDSKPTILITRCTFNVQENTKSSIHYVRGNSKALVKVSQCDFIGKLKEGARHIDGEIYSKTSPKLILTSCRFSSDSKSAFDLNPNNEYLFADLKDQVFNCKSFKNSNVNYKVSTAFIVSACTVIAALIALIIFAKKNQAPSQSENAEKSEEEAI